MDNLNAAASTSGRSHVVAVVIATLSILAPLLPIIFGMILKLVFIDEVPKGSPGLRPFIVEHYARPLWLDLIVAAYILPIGFLVSDKLAKKARAAVYLIPAAVFVVCVFFVQGLPKLGLSDTLWTIGVPDFLGVICLVVVGMIVYRNAT